MTSARPFESAFSVENRSNTRTGSSVLSTVTADPSRMRSVARRDSGEDDLRRGNREVAAVMLADAKRIEADLVGEHAFRDDVAKPGRRN